MQSSLGKECDEACRPSAAISRGCHCIADRRAGLSMMELLVSLTVISVLLALLLPAVQSSRESARQTQCKNHLRQMGVAVHGFESTHQFFPSNGWGFLWMGDPDRGVGKQQPGGWIYHLLPYIEAQPLANVGRGAPTAVKRLALSAVARQPLGLFKCPSRPGDQVGPFAPDLPFWNAIIPSHVAKTDYAINEGDYITNTPGGPATLAEGDDPDYDWTDVTLATGVSFLRSEVRPNQIADGMSNTYLIGEKYVSQGGYLTADDDGHDQPMYSGVDLDINRWTTSGPLPDGLSQQIRRFGSAHLSGCNFVLCDGSVRSISYLIDVRVHRSLGNRRDGKPSDF